MSEQVQQTETQPTGPTGRTEPVEHLEPTPHQGPLWFSFLAGPVLWSIQLMVVYAIASLACNARSTAGTPIVHILTLVFVLITAYAGYRAWRRWRVLDLPEETVAGGGGGSAAFLALSGVFLSVVFILLLISEDIATFVLTPCVGGR